MRNLLTLSLFLISFIRMSAINYTLSFPNPENHYCHVNVEFTAHENNPIVGMPVWAPGSYLVREFSKNMEKIESNKSFNKIKKNQWRIEAQKGDKVSFSYLLYGNEVSVRTNFITSEHAFISPSGTFLYVKGLEQDKHIVDVQPHKNWEKVACGLINPENDKQVIADNYDLLVDAPIEVGNHDVFTFEVKGVTHTVAMVGKNNADYKQLAKDMKHTVETTIDVWGELPVKRYLFIVENTENGRGGLEHLNSTVLMMARNTYNDTAKYVNFLSLVAHEYFHLWNVKRLRPVELGPFNYDEENYTELLWFFEGFTAYYDELLLHRAGFIDKEAYLKRVSKNIEATENRPGVKVQTVAEASYDAWIKAYRSNENTVNTTISYYGKGSIVALLLDFKLIKESNCKYNLDDLMQKLYAIYKSNPAKGIVEKDIIAAANELAGKDISSFFKQIVHTTSKPDYKEVFKEIGLTYEEMFDTEKVYLGTSSKKVDGKLIVQNVKRNTCAFKAGVNANDELIAINGDSIQSLSDDLKRFKVGETIKSTILRDGILFDLPIVLSSNPAADITITTLGVMDDPKSYKQRTRRLEKWLKK